MTAQMTHPGKDEDGEDDEDEAGVSDRMFVNKTGSRGEVNKTNAPNLWYFYAVIFLRCGISTVSPSTK